MVIWILSKANSMTSLVCFVLVSGVLAATSVPALARRRVVVNLLVATVLLAAALPLFLNVTGLLEILGRDASLTGRTEIWQEALALDRNPILGAGFESFWLGPRLDRNPTIYTIPP